MLSDTRVIPARLYAVKDSGGEVENLLERLLDEVHILAQVRASKAPKHGTRLRACRHAVQDRYRFFSYGDAMLLQGS